MSVKIGTRRLMPRLVTGTQSFTTYHAVVVVRGHGRWLDLFECAHDDHLVRADAAACLDAQRALENAHEQ